VNKYFFGLILLFITCTAVAQKKPTPVILIQSETTHGIKLNGKDLIKIYKGVFQQESTIFRSDSAYLYSQDNAVDAFGHVVITQGDTLHIYSDKLNYQGNIKIAILTDNVKLVDKDATLTTNYFTYNTGTRIGTYTGGGKLVNKENTLVSKNGYYFSNSRDSYFRYNVVLTTVDAVIKTDTLRYNTGTRISYFYGPTNIYGKDKDTLYTENGTYNTQTEQAFFGKNNLYKKGTKSLKGDSLFYDRLKGYGKAIKHVTFLDKEQKVIIKGDLGVYTKEDERTVMTQHPYVVLVTEDSVKTDSAKVKDVPIPVKPDNKNVKNEIKALSPPAHSQPKIEPDNKKVKELAAHADTILKRPSSIKDVPIPAKRDDKSVKSNVKALPATHLQLKIEPDKKMTANVDTTVKQLPSKTKRDSIYLSGDTIETQIILFRDLKLLQEQRRIIGLKDTSIKLPTQTIYTKPVKYIPVTYPVMFRDTDFLHPNYFPKKARDTTQKVRTLKKGSKLKIADTKPKIDSVYMSRKIELSDTSRIRVLIAAHHAKIFKSDLQAVADSIFYSYADSTARMYVHPMIWTSGSQLSGDTVNLQLRNKKVDNIELYPSAFIVNIAKGDSVHFNQVGGRKMRGFFKNSKIDVVYVDGNAETIYYNRDSTGKHATEMDKAICSRIRVNFQNNDVMAFTWYGKPERRDIPIAKIKEEDKVLKGFLWKPKDRPVSKESVISPPPPPDVKKDDKKAADKKPVVKTGSKPDDKPADTKSPSKPGAVKTTVNTIKSRSDSISISKIKADSIGPVKIKADTNLFKQKQ
jgi:lipopolysaccharide export system protein LptA